MIDEKGENELRERGGRRRAQRVAIEPDRRFRQPLLERRDDRVGHVEPRVDVEVLSGLIGLDDGVRRDVDVAEAGCRLGAWPDLEGLVDAPDSRHRHQSRD